MFQIPQLLANKLINLYTVLFRTMWPETKISALNSFFLMDTEEDVFVWVQHEPTLSLTSYNLLISLIRIVLVLIGVAYFTLAERKIMASIQRRRGPNVVGIFGLLQPLADGLKLLCKEMVVPTKANALVFLVAPVLIITLSLVGWLVIPFSPAPSLNISSQVPSAFISPVTAEMGDVANRWVPVRNFYYPIADLNLSILFLLSLIHIWRCRRRG